MVEENDIVEQDGKDLPEVEVSESREQPKPQTPKSSTSTDTDVQYWQRETAGARREAQRHRTNLRNVETERDAHATRAAKYDTLLTEFGIEDESTFDPKSFAQTYKDVLTSHQHTRRQYEVHRIASRVGADPDLLLDSNSFMGKVTDLNPDDKKFRESLESLVKETMDNNPVFGAKKGSTSTSAATVEVKGSNGELMITSEQLSAMTSSEIVAARKAGKLKHLGF